MICILKRYIIKLINIILVKKGFCLFKSGFIHGSPEYLGAIIFSRKLDQFYYFYDMIKNVEGDVIESGIWWGYGILAHLRFVTGEWRKRKIFAFDSFEGHSAPNDRDKKGGGYANPGSSFSISQDDVWKTLEIGTERKLVELKNIVTIIPGWIQDTLPKFISNNSDRKIALVHCDPDLYEPIFVTLSNVWNNLVPGGIIIIGRLNNPEYMGKTEAVNDFLKTIPDNSYKLESIKIQELETCKEIDLFYIKKVLSQINRSIIT